MDEQFERKVSVRQRGVQYQSEEVGLLVIYDVDTNDPDMKEADLWSPDRGLPIEGQPLDPSDRSGLTATRIDVVREVGSTSFVVLVQYRFAGLQFFQKMQAKHAREADKFGQLAADIRATDGYQLFVAQYSKSVG